MSTLGASTGGACSYLAIFAYAFSSAARNSMASDDRAGPGEGCGTGAVAHAEVKKANASVAHCASRITTSRAVYELILRLTDSDCASEASPSSMVCSCCCTTPSLFSKDTATRTDFDLERV